jgi:hypothetical protein
MSARYWALFTQQGELHRFIGDQVGPHFFSNAKSENLRVAIVELNEIPMTGGEARQMLACPCCGKNRAE